MKKRKRKNTPLSCNDPQTSGGNTAHVLEWIVTFLNAENYMEQTGKGVWLEPPSTAQKQLLKQSLQAAQAARDLRPELIKLLKPIAKPDPNDEDVSRCYRSLIGQINRRELRTGFHLVDGVIRQNFYASAKDGEAESMVSQVYANFATALTSGGLKRLRCCPYCGSFFFIRKSYRDKFCPGHARLYHDEPSLVKYRVYKSRSKILLDMLAIV